MKYQKVSLKKLFKTIRKNPSQAIDILKAKPELAHATWSKGTKWIVGSTPLHWAAHDGHMKLVKVLLELGAPVNADDADWWCRPVDWAADSGRHKIVRLLLKNGATMGGDKWSNCTPLHVVAQGGATNGKENSANYKKTAEALIKVGADVNAIATYGGRPPGMTPLDDAQNVKNKAVEKVLLTYGGKNRKALPES